MYRPSLILAVMVNVILSLFLTEIKGEHILFGETALTQENIVMNENLAVVGQVVGTPILLKETNTISIELCISVDKSITLREQSFDTPDFGVLLKRPSVGTEQTDGNSYFVPIGDHGGIDNINYLEEESMICGNVNHVPSDGSYVGIFRYQDYESVSPCKYDNCYTCDGDNSTCPVGCEADDSCECCPGMSGPDCLTHNLCYEISCLNGGLCNHKTGLCICLEGWWGGNCEVPTCNMNGYFISEEKGCQCLKGWKGHSCDTCDDSPKPGRTHICVPSSNPHAAGYILMSVSKDVASDVVAGKAYIPGSEQWIAEKKKPHGQKKLSYGAIYPGDIGYDRHIRDCTCSTTSLESRDIAQDASVLFTQDNLNQMARSYDLSLNKRSYWRQRSLSLGLSIPKDTEPGAFEQLLEESKSTIVLKNNHVEELEEIIEELTEELEKCEKKLKKNDCSQQQGILTGFWILLPYAIITTLIIIVLIFYMTYAWFGTPSANRRRERNKDISSNIGSKMDRNEKKKGKKKRRKESWIEQKNSHKLV